MAYNLKYNTGMIENPISFRDTNGLNVENIVSLMSQKAEELGVPARITTSTVKEGGLFGSTYPCVVINHPNPPQQYFTDVDYSGTLRATCPDFESHHSGEWEPYIPVIQSHLIGLYYIYFLYTVNTHLWCEYR